MAKVREAVPSEDIRMPLFSCNDCGAYVFEISMSMQKDSRACVSCCRIRRKKYEERYFTVHSKALELRRKRHRQYKKTEAGMRTRVRAQLKLQGYEFVPDALVEAHILNRKIRAKLGRRCSVCSVRLSTGRNCSHAQQSRCNSCGTIEQSKRRNPNYKMSKKLKHRLYMREYMRKKSAQNKQGV